MKYMHLYRVKTERDESKMGKDRPAGAAVCWDGAWAARA